MRAVNLIPRSERSSGVLGTRSGGGVHLLLLGLAGLVVLAALWTKAGWDEQAASTQAQRTTAEAVVLEARASATPTAQASWAQLRDQRLRRVTTLVDARFDWAHALRELARVLPADVDVTSLDATVAPGSGAGGSGGGAGGVRSALAVPALELSGCAQDHDHVMAAVSALRAMDGVQRVTLESSERPVTDAGTDAASAPDGATADGCRPSRTARPTFAAVAFLTPPAGTSAAATPAAGSVAP